MTQQLLPHQPQPLPVPTPLGTATTDCGLLALRDSRHMGLAGESGPALRTTKPKQKTHLDSSEHLLRATSPKLVFLPWGLIFPSLTFPSPEHQLHGLLTGVTMRVSYLSPSCTRAHTQQLFASHLGHFVNEKEVDAAVISETATSFSLTFRQLKSSLQGQAQWL